ncbi:MAG TPA: PIG-L deacetylase family protein [Thermodesulfovibrionia bacterium]|nr:PIG-L deacetylase family protein [Thermodesulfovibrionia bacterium]
MITFQELADKIGCAMAIAAHPDDLEFECAGTMALLRKLGKTVVYVIATTGEKGKSDLQLSSYEISRIREEEQREAAAAVGVHEVVFLRFSDGELENNAPLRARLVENIRRYCPDVIFAMDPAHRAFNNPYIHHRDHRIIGEAVFDAAYPASGNSNFFQEQLIAGLNPHEPKALCFFGTHAPDLYVDITSVMNDKIRALMCHKSQVSHMQHLENVMKEEFNKHGQKAGCLYAEAFRLVSVEKDQ